METTFKRTSCRIPWNKGKLVGPIDLPLATPVSPVEESYSDRPDRS